MSGKKSIKIYSKYLVILFIAIYFAVTNLSARTKNHDAKATFLKNAEVLNSMIADVLDAKRSIYIAIYMFKTTESSYQKSTLLEEALFKALKNGVKVFILMDMGKDDDITTEINKETGRELREKGATVVFDSKETKTHAKLMVIDEEITYIGSHNYTHSAFNYNNETTARITSEEFASEAIEYIKSISK